MSKLFIKITIKEKHYFFPMPQKTVVIGRSSDCEIKINDDFSSALHCSIILSNNSLIVKDLDSKNGTFMNGERIDQVNVYNGDIVSFGSISFCIDQVHTDDTLLKQYAPPANRSKSIPYYSSQDITKTHIKLKDFKLKEDKSPVNFQHSKQGPKPNQAKKIGKSTNFSKSKKTLFGKFKDFLGGK